MKSSNLFLLASWIVVMVSSFAAFLYTLSLNSEAKVIQFAENEMNKTFDELLRKH